jgi:hypothetical protein
MTLKRSARSTAASRRTRAPVTTELNGYRGQDRSGGEELQRLNVTLPSDVLLEADLYVAKRKRQAGQGAYNRSALIDEALRQYLAREA